MAATGKDAKKEDKKKEEARSALDAAKYGFGVIFRGEAPPVPMEHWYRGDNAPPTQIHSEGFKAQGTSMDIISHARPVDGSSSSSASGYVSTTTSLDVALRHPYEFPAGTSQSFIYEIAPQSNAVDVPKAFIANPADPRVSAYMEDYLVNIAYEHEKAVLGKIEARDIRGAWPVQIMHQYELIGKMHPSAIESSDYIRLPKMAAQDFIPNPYYLPRNMSEPKVFEYGIHLAPPNIAVSATAVGAIQTISLLGTGYALYEAGQLVIKSDHPVQEAQKQASLFSAAVIVGSQVGAIATPYCLRGALFHPPTAPVTFPLCVAGASVAGAAAGAVGLSLGMAGVDYAGSKLLPNRPSYSPADLFSGKVVIPQNVAETEQRAAIQNAGGVEGLIAKGLKEHHDERQDRHSLIKGMMGAYEPKKGIIDYAVDKAGEYLTQKFPSNPAENDTAEKKATTSANLNDSTTLKCTVTESDSARVGQCTIEKKTSLKTQSSLPSDSMPKQRLDAIMAKPHPQNAQEQAQRSRLEQAGGVEGLIAQGLKQHHAEQERKQKQEAHEKIVEEEKRYQAANLHAQRQAHQWVIDQTRCFNVPYNSYSPRVNTYDLAWRVEQQAIWEFRLRYGSCPSWVERAIRSDAQSAISSLTFGGYGYSGVAEFSATLMATSLINSYNSYNLGSRMYSSWDTYGLIGGVATKVASITDMVNSKAHALADAYYLCFAAKNVRFPDNLMKRVMWELTTAYKEKTLPFFSLHFNKLQVDEKSTLHSLYPVLHPAYQTTLIGEIIGLLDYWMKGYLNGGIFDEGFLRKWHEKPNFDEAWLKSNMIDLKKYCQENMPSLGYLSLRELENRYGLKDKRSDSPYQQPFMTSFRIIASQEKIERQDNILIPYPTFTVEYSVDIMPDYQQYVEAYQRENGTLPPEYQQTLRCYQLFAEEVKTKMPKLPFCRDYFALLGVINSLCYVYRTLDETGQEPKIDFPESGVYATFPKALPPIPVRYYRSYNLALTLKDVLSLLRSNDEKIEALDKALSLLFNSNVKIDFPVEVKQQLEATIRNKILEMLKPQVTPQDLSELNEVDIANIVDRTMRAILTVARNESPRIHRALNKRIESFSWLTKVEKDALKKLPILAKIEQANKEQESHFQALKLRWEANPELAKSELPSEFSDIAAAFEEGLKEAEKNIWEQAKEQVGGNLSAAQEAEVKKFIAESEQKKRVKLIEVIHEELSKQFAGDIEFASHFSNLFVTNTVLSEYSVSEHYTHSFVGFTGNDLATKTGDNFRIVGGCGMSVPNVEAEPIPHGDSFTATVEKAFSHAQQEEARFEHNGTAYVAYRVPVVKKAEELRSASRLEWEYSLSMEILEAIHSGLMSPRTFAFNIGKRWVDDKGTTLMHRAAAILKPSLLEELIRETERALFLRDQYGNLPIHAAAESGNVKNIELMLQKEPGLLDEKNHRGVTPLIVATQYGQLEVIQLLHSKGADFNYFLPNGLFPLYMAIQKNFRMIALWMLDNVQQLNVNQELDSQMTSLHLAIQGEETELALKLIARSARCDIRRKSDGFTALHCASKEGNVKVLAAILTTPISVNLALESKKTPLMLAAEAGQLEVVKLLIQKGADVNAVALNDETAFMLAICAGRKEVAMYLAGIAQVNAVNSRQQTASLLAVQYAMPIVADILVKRGEDVTRLDRNGFNCLYYLVRNGEYARVKQLANRGVSFEQIFAGQSLLAVAAQNGHFLIVNELEERKVPYKSSSNFSLLHYAVMANEIELLRKNYSSVKDLKSLAVLAIQYHAKESLLFLLQNMTKKDCGSRELMVAAIVSNDEEIVNIVLKDCEDINAVLDAQGNMAAHIAVMHGAHQVLPLLIESGAKLNKPNQKKQTPYHLAIAQEDEDMLKRLFKVKISNPEEWPQDLRQIEATPLNAKIMRILNKYKKHLPEKSKGAKPSPARGEGLREKIVNPLPVGPILSETERHILKLFKSSLKDADYGYALSLLCEHPILIKVLKSQNGGGLLALLFENISELAEAVLSTEGEKEKSPMQHSPLTDSALEDLLTLLKQEGVNPAHYLGKHNVLVAITKAKTDKEACYRFERLARHFPQALPILANDKSDDNKLGIVELCLSLGKDELFEKLDGYCQKLENDHNVSFYALHEAVLANNYGMVQRLLRRYPVDTLNAEGQTPLMLAAKIGSVPLVNLLLKHGAFIDKCDRFGRNPLHYALIKPSIETALLVLPLLRNPNQADRFGMSSMMKAALRGVVSVMRFLAETNHDIHSVDKYGYNALHYAALGNQVESIAFLVSHKFAVDAVEAPLKESKIAKCKKKTPLMLAAEQGQENALYELLRLEANPEQKDTREFSVCEYGIISKNKEVQDLIKKLPFYHDPGRNLYLLHAAVMANELVILSELILSNANQNALNTQGQNALHIACIYDAPEAASLLLKGGSLVLDALDKFGYMPIHYAAQKGYIRLIRLLGENGADLNQKTTKGETPLTLVCLSGYEGAVIALLEHGADFKQPNQDGMTPIHLALLKGFFPIVRLLQEAGDTSLKTDDFSSVPEQERKIIKFNLTLFSADRTSVRKTHLMRFLKPHKSENPISIGLDDKLLALNRGMS